MWLGELAVRPDMFIAVDWDVKQTNQLTLHVYLSMHRGVETILVWVCSVSGCETLCYGHSSRSCAQRRL